MQLKLCRFTAVLVFVILGSLHYATAQKAIVVKFDALQKILNTKSNQIQVINFWATWCAPCVKELPLLEKINSQKNLNAKITLINLDYVDKLDKVNEFMVEEHTV
jgi:thiol-disulfide isomerase/thioredoxin